MLLILLITGIIGTVFSANTFYDCYGKWTNHIRTNKCIRVFKESRTFSEAQKFCQVCNGNLVAIHYAFQNEQVENIGSEIKSCNRYWIGLTNYNMDSFIWMDLSS